MKRLVRIAAVVLGILLLLAVALPYVVDANTFRPALEARLGEAMSRQVKLGDLRLSLLSGAVAAGDLAIADDPAYGKEPFVQAKSIKIGVELMPLIFSRKLNVTRIVVEQPRVALIQSASGQWNFSTIGSRAPAAPKPDPAAQSGKPLDLAVKLLKIDDGYFSIGGRQPLILEKVNLELRDFSATSASPFSFRAKAAGGGDIKLEGSLGPIAEPDATRTPLEAKLEIDKLSLAGSGIATFDGAAKSDGKIANARGKLRVEKLKLADRGTAAERPVEFEFDAEHRLAERAGRLSKGDLHIGAAVAHLSGTYSTRSEPATLHVSVTGDSMPVPELATLLPPLGITLPRGATLQGGTARMKLAMEGPTERLVTAGTLSIDNTTVANFDLGRKMAVIEALAGIKQGSSTQIQTLAGSIRATPEGTAAENLQLIVPSIGELTGAGTISPTNALDFRMTAKALHLTVPLLVQGTTADPSFRPDVKTIVTEKAKGVAGNLIKGFLGGKRD